MTETTGRNKTPLPTLGGIPIGFITTACNVVWIILMLARVPFPWSIAPLIVGVVIGGAAFAGDFVRTLDEKKRVQETDNAPHA